MTGMTSAVTIWANPLCSKSRGAEALLAERGVAVERVLYLQTPPSRAEIERVLGLLGTDDPRSLIRSGEPAYRDLDLGGADRDRLLDALAEHPELIERPVVIRGERAVVARPPERLLDLLDD
jgi:arsenate reductase (glutaredoxin)